MQIFKLKTFASYNLSHKKVESLHETHYMYDAYAASIIYNYIYIPIIYMYQGARACTSHAPFIDLDLYMCAGTHVHHIYSGTHPCMYIYTYIHNMYTCILSWKRKTKFESIPVNVWLAMLCMAVVRSYVYQAMG